MTTRQQVVDQARKALGTRWVHQRCLPPHACDCVGLITWTNNSLGFPRIEPPPYDKTSQWHIFLPWFRRHGVERRLGQEQIGDVLCFRQTIYPCHCGIITTMGNNPHFIHSFALRKRVVEERFSPEWRRLVVGVFSFRGLED